MKLFDTHCHLNFEAFQKDWPEVLARSIASGVTMMNVIGSQLPTSEQAVHIAETYPEHTIATVGVHPTHVHEERYRSSIDEVMAALKALALKPPVKAVGETGLDYFRLEEYAEQSGVSVPKIKMLQLAYFERSIALAAETNTALVLHCREAYEDFYGVLKRSLKQGQRGTVHFYIGTPELLPQFLELGLYIGYTGVITFPNTERYAENVRQTPLDRIVVETDAPYVAPKAYRGQRNEPAYVAEVVKQIAEIKGVSAEETAAVTFKNAQALFALG